jgi:hypothetical protein
VLNKPIQRSGVRENASVSVAVRDRGEWAIFANSRTATGLIRMFRSWFSPFSVIPRHARLPAIRTMAVMPAICVAKPEWISRPGNKQIPSYRVYNNDIQRSERDERDYRVIRLQNGLEAMLVHDVKADKAAASLDVAVGHLYDPVRCVSTSRSSTAHLLGTSPTCQV